MKARDAARLALDEKTDALSVDAGAVDELFAVVDLLEAEAPLRRYLSDPSATPEDRAALARRLFAERISPSALSVLTAVVTSTFPSGRRLVDALEAQAVRALLREAQRAGDLPRVQEELHGFVSVVGSNVALADALRNRTHPPAARRELVARLTASQVHPVTSSLLARAAALRERTLPLAINSYLATAAAMASERIARVTVASALDEGRTARLRAALESFVGGAVSLQVEVDPSVLGGMDVKLGDHIIESTVAGRLDEARRLLTTH